MSRTSTKAKWLAKLARSSNYIVLTDTESVICVENVDPRKFEGIFMVSSQLAALQKFRKNLDGVIKGFEKEIASMYVRPKAKRSAKPKATKKKVIKIPVKEVK